MIKKMAIFCICGLVTGAFFGFLLRPYGVGGQIDGESFMKAITSFGEIYRLGTSGGAALAKKTANTFYAFLIGGGAVGLVIGYFANLLAKK